MDAEIAPTRGNLGALEAAQAATPSRGPAPWSAAVCSQNPGGLVAGELQQTLQRQGAAALPRRRKYWWQAWRIGGNAAKLTPKRRKDIARKAAAARWGKKQEKL